MNPNVACVVDDLVTDPPWTPRGVTVKGPVQIHESGGEELGPGFRSALVLTTVGRKSGVERSTPVGWFLGEDGEWLIVASAAGAARNPAWYYNIAAHPDKVRIELSGREVDVVATQLHRAAREQAWRQITAAAPLFAQYQEKTDRQLPRCRKPPSIDTITPNTSSTPSTASGRFSH